MTDYTTESSFSDRSATADSSSTTISTSDVITSVSLPDVFNSDITELEKLDLKLKLNVTETQGRVRQIHSSNRDCHSKNLHNESYFGRPSPKCLPFGYEDDMKIIKQGMLTYFQDLGGNPDLIRQNKIARDQLDELCHIYYFSKYTNKTYGYATNALVSMIMTSSNEDAPPGSPISSIVAPSFHNIYHGICDIPVPDNPEYNLIGRILGPRGMSIRELESRFRCRIFVRGRGSIRDPKKAEILIKKPGWKHLTEPLHVHIEVQGFDKQEVDRHITEIQSVIDRLLHPQGFDAFKRRQLISLAFMNGTFRPPAQLKHLHFNQVPVPFMFKQCGFSTDQAD